jgi:hypothetical protein
MLVLVGVASLGCSASSTSTCSCTAYSTCTRGTWVATHGSCKA